MFWYKPILPYFWLIDRWLRCFNFDCSIFNFYFLLSLDEARTTRYSTFQFDDAILFPFPHVAVDNFDDECSDCDQVADAKDQKCPTETFQSQSFLFSFYFRVADFLVDFAETIHCVFLYFAISLQLL